METAEASFPNYLGQRIGVPIRVSASCTAAHNSMAGACLQVKPGELITAQVADAVFPLPFSVSSLYNSESSGGFFF